MAHSGRVVTSNSDLGLVNQHHNEIASERTLVRREKLANEVFGGALNDFFRAACERDFIQIGTVLLIILTWIRLTENKEIKST